MIYANGGVARLTVGWQLTARLAELFRAERFDVVHVHGGLNPTLGIVAPWAAFRAGIPVVATFHTWFPRSVGYRGISRAPATHARSPRGDDRREPHGARGDGPLLHCAVGDHSQRCRYDVLPSEPPTRWNAFRTQASPRLLWLGRIGPRNDLRTVLAAMPQIRERFPGAQLTVVGDGPGARGWAVGPAT